MESKCYQETCPRCGGTGKNRIIVVPNLKNFEDFLWDPHSGRGVRCGVCLGKGKIDWIDKIKLESKLNEKRKL